MNLEDMKIQITDFRYRIKKLEKIKFVIAAFILLVTLVNFLFIRYTIDEVNLHTTEASKINHKTTVRKIKEILK